MMRMDDIVPDNVRPNYFFQVESNCVTKTVVIIVVVIFITWFFSFDILYRVIAFKQIQTVYTNFLFFSVYNKLYYVTLTGTGWSC